MKWYQLVVSEQFYEYMRTVSGPSLSVAFGIGDGIDAYLPAGHVLKIALVTMESQCYDVRTENTCIDVDAFFAVLKCSNVLLIILLVSLKMNRATLFLGSLYQTSSPSYYSIPLK